MHLNPLFQRTVRLHAKRPALALGERIYLDYSELADKVSRLAAWLRQDFRLSDGDRVAIVMKNSVEYAETMLACWHAGLCAVPVNSKLHPAEIEYILADSGAAVCFSSGDLYQTLSTRQATAGAPTWIDVKSEAYRAGAQSSAMPAFSGSGDDIAWLFYTSGTTGRPKGVMITHANLVAMSLNFFADVQAVSTNDGLVHAAPMSHGSGIYSIPYFIQGGLQIIPESGGFDEEELNRLLHHYSSVSLFAAPTMVQRTVAYSRDRQGLWPGLRTIVVGGAPFYVEEIRAAVACFGPRIAQIYGQGESPMSITALSSAQIARAVDENDEELLASVGAHQAQITMVLLDEKGHPVPTGSLGEVSVSGPTVMRGYWNNPEASAQALANGFLRTGDIGVLDERGLLQLKDRSKDVIISGGVNIYPREVEEVLLKHPAIKEVSVIGMPDPEWGESVLAFVVSHTGHPVPENELNTLCLENIARFKRPRQYIHMNSLPKNGTGKILKTELRNELRKVALSSS